MATESHEAYVRLRSQRPPHDWLVHPELRQRLVEQAEREGSNMSEVAVQILSRRYRVPVQPTGRKGIASVAGDVLLLRIPYPLLDALENAARGRRLGRGFSYVDEIRHALCSYYDLGTPPKPRHIRARRAAAPPAAAR